MRISIREQVQEWLRRWLLAGEEQGTRVVRSGWPLSVQSVEADGKRVTTVGGAGGFAGELVLERGPAADKWQVAQRADGKTAFVSAPMGQREAKTLYKDMQRQLLGNVPGRPTGGGRAFRWALLAAALYAIIVVTPAPSTDSRGAQARAAVPERSEVAGGDTAEPRLDATQLTMLKTAAARGGVSFADSGKPFYVFSDPKCPYCQQLEETLAKLGPGHKPVILPVAYKQGAKDVAQTVLCTRDAKAAGKLWRQALAKPDAAVPANACPEGLTALADNMTLFEMLRLTGTPALITSTGRMYSGASGATVEQLRAALELP